MKRFFLHTLLVLGGSLTFTPAPFPSASPQEQACWVNFAVIGDYGQDNDPEEGEVAALIHG
jgi:hypothetical protein